jgi:predicted CoA-binding protein
MLTSFVAFMSADEFYTEKVRKKPDVVWFQTNIYLQKRVARRIKKRTANAIRFYREFLKKFIS